MKSKEPSSKTSASALCRAAAAVAAAMLAAGAPAAGDGVSAPPAGAVLVGGLAVLVGGSPGEEDEATTITVSQIDLEVDLLLIRRHGPDWRSFREDGTLRLQARRVAALVRLLARLARHMGETVTADSRVAAIERLEELAGGSRAMGELLARHGATGSDLETWVEDALLAVDQIRFQAERSRGWSERGEAGRRGARREERDVRMRQGLDGWLPGVLERNLLRFLP